MIKLQQILLQTDVVTDVISDINFTKMLEII